MKKLISLALLLFMCFSTSITSHASVNDMTGMRMARATAYCQTGITKSGQMTRYGVCSATEAWLGKTILVYQRLPGNEVGELIGIYECLDTGSSRGIKNGNVVDIWRPNLDECQDFMNTVYADNCGGKVWIKIIDAVG